MLYCSYFKKISKYCAKQYACIFNYIFWSPQPANANNMENEQGYEKTFQKIPYGLSASIFVFFIAFKPLCTVPKTTCRELNKKNRRSALPR